MKALLIIDMQVGSFGDETPRHDVDGVVERVNEVAQAIRANKGLVVFIQHEGPEGDTFARGETGWEILPELSRKDGDVMVSKTACDAFYKTELDDVLSAHQINDVLITGCATDFCVDTTVRAAASRDYDVTVISDAHTTADRPHLDAVSIIDHHNKTWVDLIIPGREVKVLSATKVLENS